MPHWFGLTDGFYHLNVGKEQIYRNTNEILNCRQDKYPEYKNPDIYVDYQIVRLYEDFLDTLSDVLQPIQKEILALIDTHDKKCKLLNIIDYIYCSAEDYSILDDCDDAMEWRQRRHLSSMHLSYPPYVVMWRHENSITFRWDNKNNVEHDIPVWSSQGGEYQFSVAEFMHEVESFHNRFMSAMKERVNIIVIDNPMPNVNIDIDRLVQEHGERELSLEHALKRQPCVKSWETVISANQRLSIIIEQSAKS